MKRWTAFAAAAIFAFASTLLAAEPGTNAVTEVTGKVVALQNLEGGLSAVKLLGKDGRIYDVTLNERGTALAGEALRVVEVKGTVVEQKAQGEKPAKYLLTVISFTSAELAEPSAVRGGERR
jgi:hypothetical protein